MPLTCAIRYIKPATIPRKTQSSPNRVAEWSPQYFVHIYSWLPESSAHTPLRFVLTIPPAADLSGGRVIPPSRVHPRPSKQPAKNNGGQPPRRGYRIKSPVSSVYPQSFIFSLDSRSFKLFLIFSPCKSARDNACITEIRRLGNLAILLKADVET